MPRRAHVLDLAALKLTSGEGRRLEVAIPVPPFTFSEERYAVDPSPVAATLALSRMAGRGYALRVRFDARLEGPCMRCLEPASPVISVDAREVNRPGEGEELASPYVSDGDELDIEAWARDALALALPNQIVCREDCAGLCPICGADLNAAGPEHGHEPAADPRWAKLRELELP